MSSVDQQVDSAASGNSASFDLPLETWTLNHPELGLLEAHVGWYEQLLTVDPDFPDPSKLDPVGSDDDDTDDIDADDGNSDGDDDIDPEELAARYHAKAERFRQRIERRLGPERAERLRTWSFRDQAWHARGIVITRDGTPIARLATIKNARMPLRTSMPAGQVTKSVTTQNARRIQLDVAGPSRFVTGILIKINDEVVAFDPPPGSPGARRQAEMETSSWKRLAYPLLGGLGKAGWAIWVIVVGPLIGKLLEPVINFFVWLLTPIVTWLASLIPDINIPWPHINWPDIDLPGIPWPHINWPTIPWPHIDLPPWLKWLLEHPKTWTPIVIALFMGVMAVRNNKKSQATKAEWEAQKRERELTRLAGALRALEERRSQGN